jgi:chromatin remodeling complex protein RSC6
MKGNKILTNFSDFELRSNSSYLGISKPLSEELAEVVGVKVALESAIGKKLAAYIMDNKLQDLTNSRQFRCDEKLRRIFSVERFKYLEILTHLYKYNHILFPKK